MQQRVAVIGGGPAGLTAALTAVERGMTVALWEAGEVGENINCAEGFFDPLKLLQPPAKGVRYRVNRVIIECKETVQIDTGKLNLWMLDRRGWQQALAREAVDRGVDIQEQQRIAPRELDHLQADFDWVLDASGIPAVSSLRYNFRESYQPEALVTVQYRMNGDFSSWERAFKVVLFEDIPGYAWIFPRDKESANIGLGIFNIHPERGPKGEELYKRLDCFLERERVKGEIISRAAGICPNRQPERLVRDNLLLLGDAAGLTSPLHGGGIDLACFSGRQAVEAIAAGDAHIYPEKLREKVFDRFKLEEELLGLWQRDYAFFSKLIRLFSERNRVDRLFLSLLGNPAFFIRALPLLWRLSSVYINS